MPHDHEWSSCAKARPPKSEPLVSQCLISFGSNLGTREQVIAEAAIRVQASEMVVGFRASRLFETPPIGGPGGQEPFLNAVAAFETQASARDILDLLQGIENDLGRQRKRRWDARSIDLDVVLHGELVGGGTGLIVPHPRYTARQFVLQPACDVAAHYRDPRFDWTLQRLADHLSLGAASMALVGGDESTRETLCQRLTAEYGIRTFDAPPIAEPMAVVGNAPAALREKEKCSSGATTPQIDAPPLEVEGDAPWVAAYVPPLPLNDEMKIEQRCVPRLVARIQYATPDTSWPAPHQMWPAGWEWPEYRLEVDDMDWAVSEVASALDSMRCPAVAVTDDGNWWRG